MEVESLKLNPSTFFEMLRLYRVETSRVLHKYEDYSPESTPDVDAIPDLVNCLKRNKGLAEVIVEWMKEVTEELKSDHRNLQRKLNKSLWG